jgi:hypothetical protein
MIWVEGSGLWFYGGNQESVTGRRTNGVGGEGFLVSLGLADGGMQNRGESSHHEQMLSSLGFRARVLRLRVYRKDLVLAGEAS